MHQILWVVTVESRVEVSPEGLEVDQMVPVLRYPLPELLAKGLVHVIPLAWKGLHGLLLFPL